MGLEPFIQLVTARNNCEKGSQSLSFLIKHLQDHTSNDDKKTDNGRHCNGLAYQEINPDERNKRCKIGEVGYFCGIS